MATKEKDYMKEYMTSATGTPELIVQGVLLFFKTQFTNEEIETLRNELSHLDEYTLANAEKVLHEHKVGKETTRQIIMLLNKKFKEAISKKAMTSKKLDFIRSVKKKH